MEQALALLIFWHRRVQTQLAASRWRFILKPCNLFLLLALPLHYTFFFHAFPLQSSSYFHGNERFLHAVSSTYGFLHAEADVIPDEYLIFAYRASPGKFRDKFHSQIPGWRGQMHNPDLISPAAECTHIPEKAHAALMKCLADSRYPEPVQILSFHSIYSAGEYSPLAYLPYMAGIAVGLLLHLAPITTYALSQITNLAVMLALAYATLRLAPVLAWPLMFLLLLPSMFAMRVFYMPDGMAIELSFLLLAVVLYLRQRAQKLDARMQAVLAALAVSVAFVKIVYFMLPLLLLLLPAEVFRSKQYRWCFIALVTGLGLLIAGWWNMHAVAAYYPVNWQAVWDSSVPMPPQKEGMRLNEGHLRALLHEPFMVIRLMFDQWLTFTGLRLTFANAGFWNRVTDPMFGDMWRTPSLLYACFFCIALLSVLEPGARLRVAFNRMERALAGGVAIATIALISIVIFAFWGSRVMHGVALISVLQGRYFIPVFPLFLLLPAFRFLENGEVMRNLRDGLCIVLVAMTLYLNYLYQLYF